MADNQILHHPTFPNVTREVAGDKVEDWVRSGWLEFDPRNPRKRRVTRRIPEDPASNARPAGEFADYFPDSK